MKIIQASTLSLAVLRTATTLALAETQDGAPMTESSVKNEIELDGYTKVENVRHEASGWTADAMESGKAVKLLINSNADIAKR